MPPEDGYDEEDVNGEGAGEPTEEEQVTEVEEQVTEGEQDQGIQESVEQMEEMEDSEGKQEEELYEPSQVCYYTCEL